jgi:hypothetical protein
MGSISHLRLPLLTYFFTSVPILPTNLLTNPGVDPVSKIPEYKICAVRIRPVYGM